jgi:hypothetical protein
MRLVVISISIYIYILLVGKVQFKIITVKSRVWRRRSGAFVRTLSLTVCLWPGKDIPIFQSNSPGLLLFCGASTNSCLRRLIVEVSRSHTFRHRHTYTHTLGRTTLNEWAARCRGRYLHKKTTNITAGFKPTIPAIQRSQNYAFVCLVGHRAGGVSGEWGGHGSFPIYRIRSRGKTAEPWVTERTYKPLPVNLIFPNEQDCRLGKRTVLLV